MDLALARCLRYLLLVMVPTGSYWWETCAREMQPFEGPASEVPTGITTQDPARVADLLSFDTTARWLGPGIGEMSLTLRADFPWLAVGPKNSPHWQDPMLDALIERGLIHERAYLDHLARQGLDVVELTECDDSAFDRTVAAMRQGGHAIYQATLANDRWHGRTDVLLRVEQESDLGPRSYEIVDTKLARETRAGIILQICGYAVVILLSAVIF